MRILVAALALAGCAGQIVHKQGADASGWRRVTTDHITLHTDVDADEARGMAVELERTYTALQEVGFPYPTHGPERIEAIVLRREEDYKPIGPPHTVGFFVDDGLLSLERVPTLVLWGDLREDTRRVLRHELTHWFARMHHAQAPVWLHEGLAEYFSTLDLADGAATLGRTPPRYVEAIARVPRAGELLRMSGAEFYGREAKDEKAVARVSANYLGAWSLVHALRNGAPELQDRFLGYLERTARGESHEQAWGATVGALPEAELDRAQRELLRNRLRGILRTALRTAAPPVREVAELDVTAYRILRARLDVRGDLAARRRARAELAAALAERPDQPELLHLRGLFGLVESDLEAAARDARAAAALRPGHAPDALLLAEALIRQPGGVRGGEIEPLVAVLKASATPRTSLVLARYLLATGRLGEALAYARKAVTADPGQLGTWVAYADVLEARGAFAAAVEACTRAVNLVPEGASAPGLDRRLRALQARAGAR